MNRFAPRKATSIAPGRVLRPVIALDIDGTLGDWYTEFFSFANKWLCRTERWNVTYDGSTSLAAHMGVTKAVYREVKLAFRQSGLKRAMLPFGDAGNLVARVRAAGAEVWVCTTRPYLRLDNIDPDTRFWLAHNKFAYDGVLFGESKYRDLARLVGSNRVLGVLDDQVEQLNQATTANLPASLILRSHNRSDWQWDGERCVNLFSAAALFERRINQWKEDNDVR
jgi:hypothetical protein